MGLRQYDDCQQFTQYRVGRAEGGSPLIIERLYPSLASGPYRRVFAGIVPYHATFQLTLVATGTAAIDLARSTFEVGLMVGAWGLAILILPPFGGAAADRFPRRRTMLWAQLVLAAGLSIAAALAVIGVLAPWHVVLLGISQGAVYAFFAPARVSYTAAAVERRLVPNAIAAYGFSEHATAVVVPVIGGLLVATPAIGYAGTWLLVAALHLGIFGIFRGLPDQPIRSDAAGEPVLSRIRAGVVYVRATPALRVAIVASGLALLLGMPFRQLLPVFSSNVFHAGPGGLGILLGASGAGAILGSMSVARLRGDRPMVRLPGLLGALVGLAVAAFAIAPEFAAAVVLAAIAGGSIAAFTTTNSAVVASAADPAYYGRAASLYQLTFAFGPLGAIPVAALADRIGPSAAVLSGGLLLVVLAPVAAWWLSRRRAPERTDPMGG